MDPEFRMPDAGEGKVHYEAQLDLWRQKKSQQPLLEGPLKGFGPAKINPLFVFCGTDVRTGLPFYFTQRTVGPLYDTTEEIMVNDDVPQSYSVPLVRIISLLLYLVNRSNQHYRICCSRKADHLFVKDLFTCQWTRS